MATAAVLGGGKKKRCQTTFSLQKVCVYWKTLLKLFPLDSNTTYCILLLCQVWYLSINVTVFSEVPKLLKTCIFHKVCC